MPAKQITNRKRPYAVYGRGCRQLALAGLALLLAACASDEGPKFACPPAVVIDDASRLTRFQGTGRDLTDVDFEASIEAPSIACTFDEDDYAVQGDLQIRIVAARGPADDDRTARLTYFVAIARASGQRVIAREEFGLSVPFEGNRTRVVALEELSPTIPISSNETGSEYRVYVGFKLTPEELEYNRNAR